MWLLFTYYFGKTLPETEGDLSCVKKVFLTVESPIDPLFIRLLCKTYTTSCMVPQGWGLHCSSPPTLFCLTLPLQEALFYLPSKYPSILPSLFRRNASIGATTANWHVHVDILIKEFDDSLSHPDFLMRYFMLSTHIFLSPGNVLPSGKKTRIFYAGKISSLYVCTNSA